MYAFGIESRLSTLRFFFFLQSGVFMNAVIYVLCVSPSALHKTLCSCCGRISEQNMRG
jgi:hypothetical protein